MEKPDYEGGSIINLMSSIGSALGHKSDYQTLRLLPPEELKDAKNIVVMLVDALGYEFLIKNGSESVFNENLKGKITSVFPTSTSAAIPALMTGDAPQKHGMTGWYMQSKEFGAQIIPLPYVPRMKRDHSLANFLDIKEIFNLQPFANKIKVKSYIVQPKKIVNSVFTIAATGKSKRVAYNNMKGYFKEIRKIIKTDHKKKFIFAYYPEHDSISHEKGSKSKEVINHFKKLNKELKDFVKSIKNTKTTLIITADHGITEVPISKRIDLEKHPKLKEMLAVPLAGEHRFAYAYIKTGKEKDFVKYMKTKLKYCSDIYKSSDIHRKGYFGLFNTHSKLHERIGDYIILMKPGYGIYEKTFYQKKNYHNFGDHGGLSKEELYVPLIVIKT